MNWIGMADVQDPAVPIMKVWDLMAKLNANGLPPVQASSETRA